MESSKYFKVVKLLISKLNHTFPKIGENNIDLSDVVSDAIIQWGKWKNCAISTLTDENIPELITISKRIIIKEIKKKKDIISLSKYITAMDNNLNLEKILSDNSSLNEIESNLDRTNILNYLKDREKTIICLIVEGYNYKEISEFLSITENLVKQITFRVKRKIVSYINPPPPCKN